MKQKKSKIDNVSNYVDLISQMVVEYFNQRYKIKKKISDVRNATVGALYCLKKEFVKTLVETLFLMTGLFALLLGIIMLLTRYIPLDILLIMYGVIVTIVILLRMKVDA